jgi:hypothetical protein
MGKFATALVGPEVNYMDAIYKRSELSPMDWA